MSPQPALPVMPVLEQSGSILRREALEYGLTQDELERLLKQGVFVRVRRGAYAVRDDWTALTPAERHLVTARAVLRSLPRPAVLGHVTAAVAHGLPVWGADLSAVHVIRRSRRLSAHAEAGVVHHASTLPDEQICEVDGLPVTSLARTVVDHARTSPFTSAVVTADAALHSGKVQREELTEMLGWQSDWPGSRGAGRAVVFADGRSESVGETRGRIQIHAAGLPAPDLQVEIRDEYGRVVARVDYLFVAQRTIGEFDGRLKYRVANAGPNLEDVLWQEKRREDALRALGYEVVRLTWDDLERAPARIRRRFLAAFARAAGRGRATLL